MSVFEGHLAGEDDIESWAMERVRLVKNEFVETQKEKIAALYDWLILIHNFMVYTAGIDHIRLTLIGRSLPRRPLLRRFILYIYCSYSHPLLPV